MHVVFYVLSKLVRIDKNLTKKIFETILDVLICTQKIDCSDCIEFSEDLTYVLLVYIQFV